MIKVLFVGSNPSTSSADNSAFHAQTRSRRVIETWLQQIDLPLDCEFMNISEQKTENNRALTSAEIALCAANEKLIARTANIKLVALGRSAEKVLTLLDLDFFAMPHPSGCNRKLNDKQYVQEKIRGLKSYLESPSINSFKQQLLV